MNEEQDLEQQSDVVKALYSLGETLDLHLARLAARLLTVADRVADLTDVMERRS
jgi:hypothetical protein